MGFLGRSPAALTPMHLRPPRGNSPSDWVRAFRIPGPWVRWSDAPVDSPTDRVTDNAPKFGWIELSLNMKPCRSGFWLRSRRNSKHKTSTSSAPGKQFARGNENGRGSGATRVQWPGPSRCLNSGPAPSDRRRTVPWNFLNQSHGPHQTALKTGTHLESVLKLSSGAASNAAPLLSFFYFFFFSFLGLDYPGGAMI